jgi:hypothetical protein
LRELKRGEFTSERVDCFPLVAAILLLYYWPSLDGSLPGFEKVASAGMGRGFFALFFVALNKVRCRNSNRGKCFFQVSTSLIFLIKNDSKPGHFKRFSLMLEIFIFRVSTLHFYKVQSRGKIPHFYLEGVSFKIIINYLGHSGDCQNLSRGATL